MKCWLLWDWDHSKKSIKHHHQKKCDIRAVVRQCRKWQIDIAWFELPLLYNHYSSPCSRLLLWLIFLMWECSLQFISRWFIKGTWTPIFPQTSQWHPHRQQRGGTGVWETRDTSKCKRQKASAIISTTTMIAVHNSPIFEKYQTQSAQVLALPWELAHLDNFNDTPQALSFKSVSPKCGLE